MDYENPKFHLMSRGHVSPDLIFGMLPANRAEWNDSPEFRGWSAQFQRAHATMTEASAQELMGLIGMNQLGMDLVDRLIHYHRFEDNSVLPRFLNLFPYMTMAVELLKGDHEILHKH